MISTPIQGTLPALLRDHAGTHPGRLAVVAPDRSLTFGELWSQGCAGGAALRSTGCTVEDTVGIFLEPSADLVAGIWTVLCAGSAYLPLSVDYPDDRLRFMIQDARPAAVLTDEASRQRLTALTPAGTPVLSLADLRVVRPAARLRDLSPAPAARADNLAYVIYTSGSTGQPKGAMIEHRGIVNQMTWLGRAQSLDGERVVLHKTPISFDAAQWEVLAGACGSAVVIAPAGTYRDPQRLLEQIRLHQVTTLQCVPTLLHALVETERLAECTSLREIYSGGEALPRQLAKRVLEAMPDCRLVNLYGPTECTINTAAHAVELPLPHGVNVPIGTSVDNTRHLILDAAGRPVGPGTVGELHVAGAQLARGYLNRPELTAARFLTRPGPNGWERLYRTGDLAEWNPDGTMRFAGRTDNQVKLRGYRVELDEISRRIESHCWVRRSAVVVHRDPRTAAQSLVAFIELDPTEAALMDQGRPSAHHRSKQDRFQIRTQLTNPGCRDSADLAGRPTLDLPGAQPSAQLLDRVFARKSYRFFEERPVTAVTVRALLADRRGNAAAGAPLAGDPDRLTLTELGALLRHFGQFHSGERLLPKYSYASPGALYATQLYLEVGSGDALAPGWYYYHPVHHRLVQVGTREPNGAAGTGLRVHLVGRSQAIEPVYAHNVREVLQIEAGHMVAVFDEALPGFGLALREVDPPEQLAGSVDAAADDIALASYEVVAGSDAVSRAGRGPAVDIYVQAHPGKVIDLETGLYRCDTDGLVPVCEELVLRRHMIAINQQVYSRAAFGVALVARRAGWAGFTDLGRALHRLQVNERGIGLMSSGYSSATGHDLPAARRLAALLGDAAKGPSYFALAGPVSPEQVSSRGMAEDVVHMRGPTEMIRDDLAAFLPDFMMPSRLVVLDRLPQTPSGKIDTRSLAASLSDGGACRTGATLVPIGRQPDEARTPTEARVSAIWQQVTDRREVGVHDDFFAHGGDSLTAVALVHRINAELGASLPFQVIFQDSTVAALAQRLDSGAAMTAQRIIPLRPDESGRPIFCWPGLGGYVMNLTTLARRLDDERPFHGVQAYGINAGEMPLRSIRGMATRDVAALLRHQSEGPFTLWGYSFGARVAFEVAHLVESAGHQVDELFLIAPGAPRPPDGVVRAGSGPDYADLAYLAVLHSVFAGRNSGPDLADCLEQVRDQASFVTFIQARYPHLDGGVVRRITRLVELTYRVEDPFTDLQRHRVQAPVTVFRARGDDCSFIERSRGSAVDPHVVDVDADHYAVLRPGGVEALLEQIRRQRDRRRTAAA